MRLVIKFDGQEYDPEEITFKWGIMLGENLKRIRNSKRMSTRELARKCNMCNSIVANIESGKSKNPTIDTVKKLAKALNVTIDELVK